MLVSRAWPDPHFGARQRPHFHDGVGEGELAAGLHRSQWRSDARTHAKGELVTGYPRRARRATSSPSAENYDVFAMPLMPGGQAVTICARRTACRWPKFPIPARDYSTGPMAGERLYWSLGPTLYSRHVWTTSSPHAPPAEDEEVRQPSRRPKPAYPCSRTVEADRHEGQRWRSPARAIITMAGEDGGIIENGTILIDGDRDRRHRRGGRVTMPGGHAHDRCGRPHDHARPCRCPCSRVLRGRRTGAAAELEPAPGSGAGHDDDPRSIERYAACLRRGRMQRAGMIAGPAHLLDRARSSTGAQSLRLCADRFAMTTRWPTSGASVREGAPSVKNYNQPRRDQRQMVVAARAAENMLVVAEGGSLFGMDMNLIADGNSTLEHNIPVMTDVRRRAAVLRPVEHQLHPHAGGDYGGLGRRSLLAAGDQRLRTPADGRIRRPRCCWRTTARRTTAPGWALRRRQCRRARPRSSRSAGSRSRIGAHGQQAGIGAHWEIWSFVRGGMTPSQALQAATIVPARSLGMDTDIGHSKSASSPTS